MKRNYDVAAYIWPAYTGKEPRTRMFWPDGIGEWQTVKKAGAKFDGHNGPRKPLWGYEDEADPSVMEKQINEAVSHGVNVFIYDWYWYDRRPFLEQCLNEGFLGAKNNTDMKFYLMWANHDANYTWDLRNSDSVNETIWLGSCNREEFDKVCERVIQKYPLRENYYKINGCPVFMIYDVDNLVKGLDGIDNTKEALEAFREKVKAAGFPDLHLQLTFWGERVHNVSGVDGEKRYGTRELCSLLRFDSMTNYQFVHFTNIDRDYREILSDVKKEWERIDSEYSIPYYPHVSVGWDNNPRYNSFRWGIVKNNTPEAIEEGLYMAKEYLDTHGDIAPLVTLNSWNEWTETSYLQPDDFYGYGYLDAVKKVFG